MTTTKNTGGLLPWASEAELAEVVAAHYRRNGWDVRQEVPTDAGPADLVFLRRVGIGEERVIVEAKLRLSADVVAQAIDRLPLGAKVLIAVPGGTRRSRGKDLLVEVAASRGIHMLQVRRYAVGGGGTAVSVQDLRPTRFPGEAPGARAGLLDRTLAEEQRTFSKAGTRGAKQFTPWRKMCGEVERFVKKNPGASLKVAAHAVSAGALYDRTERQKRKSIMAAIERGQLQVRAEQKDAQTVLYPL